MTTIVRLRMVVRGVVQGVGFRPHVARLASELGLVGAVSNDSTGVVIEIEGAEAQVAEFEHRLVAEAPPLASIDAVTPQAEKPRGATSFTIIKSAAVDGERTLVPPDTAVCDDCLGELDHPADRRYRHPFITCTNCGPRLTIIEDLPYDRPATTLRDFPMCEACRGEYADPTDRRYHAQPIGCHDCGPSLSYRSGDVEARREEALAAAVGALTAGGIVAIKGLGGYHLACDATEEAAVRRLRERKQRPAQPFAVMVRDRDAATELVELSPAAAAVLGSRQRPIVLLPAAPGHRLAQSVAPHLDELAVVLAYTPLHHLLLADLAARTGSEPVLVMTSANVSGEPLCWQDDDALARLGSIADGFLMHDRPIAVPVEDSVIAWDTARDQPVPVRRSRGYAPAPFDLGGDPDAVVLAAGAELKNTVALSQGGRAFVSAHVGDLESLAGRAVHDAVTDQLVRFHRASPTLVVADRHPGYASRALAHRFAADHDLSVHEVQHHHAHLASLAAEHDHLDEPLLGLVLDGTGYGCDASIWGCELLLLRESSTVADRLGSLGPVRLAGGDAGVRNPVRTAAVALLDAGASLDRLTDDASAAQSLSPAEAEFLTAAAKSGNGVVSTSSAGRLFDVVSALLGICGRTSYEAQAAIELEAAARRWRVAHPAADVPRLELPVIDRELPVIDPRPLVRALAKSSAEPGSLAYAFHEALARATTELARHASDRTDVTTIGLTGGVYVNRLLLAATADGLRDAGLRVLVHQQVPANDGGLALGQVAIGTRLARTTTQDVSAKA